MFLKWRRKKHLGRVRPGDGSPPSAYRLWQVFSRSLFFLAVTGDGEVHGPAPDRSVAPAGQARGAARDGGASNRTAGGVAAEPQVYAVDIRHLAEEGAAAEVYRDGVQVYRATLPAAFPVPGGVIEVATSMYGMTRVHYVADDGGERVLQPHRRSAEGLRARFGRRYPRLSTGIGRAAVAVLLVGLALGLPQLAEMITQIDIVADHLGTFTSPVELPAWANTALLVAGILAGCERALSLRNHWLVDLDTLWLSG